MVTELVRASVIKTYSKEYKVRNNIMKEQRCLVLDTLEYGTVFIRSAAKWLNNICVGDKIDVNGIIVPGNTTFLNKPKLIRKH